MSVYIGFYYGDTSNIHHTLNMGFSKLGFLVGFVQGAVLVWGPKKGPEFREPPGRTQSIRLNEVLVLWVPLRFPLPPKVTYSKLEGSWSQGVFLLNATLTVREGHKEAQEGSVHRRPGLNLILKFFNSNTNLQHYYLSKH